MATIHSTRYIGYLGSTFSPFECQLVCAILLHIKDDSGNPPTDDVLNELLLQRRGTNGQALHCRNLDVYLHLHPDENIRELYVLVNGDADLWGPRAKQAFAEWLVKSSALVRRLKAEGKLTRFFNAQGDVVVRNM